MAFNDSLNLKHEILRKSIHLTSLFTIPMMIIGGRYRESPGERYLTAAIIGAATLIYLIIEYGRLRLNWHWIGTTIVKNTAREGEKDKLILAPIAMAIGVGFTILIYPNLPIVYSAIWAAAVGDAAAAIGGKILKNPKRVGYSHKSYMGATCCFITTFIGALICTRSILLSLVGATVATLIELLPLGTWDNTLIPLFVGGAMSLTLYLM